MPEIVSRGELIATLPTWWDRCRAKAKVIGAAMTSRHDQVMTVSDDGKHIKLVDSDKFNQTQVIPGPEADAAESPPTDPGA